MDLSQLTPRRPYLLRAFYEWLLDNQLTLEGLFSIVLMAYTDGKKHTFITQSDGFTTVKSPMEMFPVEIDNDLKAVDQAIREYYELNKKE